VFWGLNSSFFMLQTYFMPRASFPFSWGRKKRFEG